MNALSEWQKLVVAVSRSQPKYYQNGSKFYYGVSFLFVYNNKRHKALEAA